jgi:hypothetical protein
MRTIAGLLFSSMIFFGAGCNGSVSQGEPASDPTGVMSPLPSESPAAPGAARGLPTSSGGLIEPGGTPMALVTTPTRVCWSAAANDGSKQSIVACAPKTGGAVTVLVRDGAMHPDLQASGETLFFSTEGAGTIHRVLATGGPPLVVVAAGGPAGRFALADGTLFWINFANGRLLGAYPSGSYGGPVSATDWGPSNGADPELIAAWSYTVYDYPAVFAFASGVIRLRPSEPAQTLSGACFYPMRLAARAGRVFWSCEDNTFRWTSTTPGDTEHVTNDVFVADIATTSQGDAIFVDDSHERVMRLRSSATAPEQIKGGFDRPVAIAADDDAAFVADSRGISRIEL